MSVLGIDLGTSHCVLATVGRGTVTVVRNELSDRLTPALVSFTDKERLIGDSALTQIKSNYRNTCRGFKNLLGRSFDDPELHVEQQYALAPLVKAENGTVGYQVQYKGETRVVNAVVVTAALLTKLRSIAEASTGISVVDVVIACPGWFTDSNRRALLAATEVAGLNCRRVLSEHTSTALDYGIFRSRDFEESKPCHVAFVSMGHSNSSVSVAEFVKGSLKILAEVSYRDLGGRDMDTAIAQHFAAIFKKQRGLDPMQNIKTRLKMEEQANRVKKILSANMDSQFHVECLMEDFDCTGGLKRSEFEEICGDKIIPRFQTLLQEAVKKSGVPVDKISAVEVVGGCTRIPWLQNVVCKFFGKTPSKTLNGDECVARGCALQAAMCSSAYKVREFSCWESTFHPIAIGWEGTCSPSVSEHTNNEHKMDVDSSGGRNMSNGVPAENKSVVVIESGMVSNVVKKLFFERPAPFDVWAFYAQPNELPSGTSSQLGKCRVMLPPSADGSNRTVALRCKLNFHGLFKFDKAELIESEEVEELVTEKQPIKGGRPDASAEGANAPPAGGDAGTQAGTTGNASTTVEENTEKTTTPSQTEEGMEDVQVRRKVKRTKKTELQIVVSENPINLTGEQIAAMREAEVEMFNDDRMHSETKERMNELETYIYEMRDKINGVLRDFIVPPQAGEFLGRLQETEDWLYDNSEAAKSQFVQNLEELRALGNPVVQRYERHERRREAVDNALQCIQQQRIVATNPDERYAHIPVEEKQQIVNEANMFEKWLCEMTTTQRSVPLHDDDTTFTAEDINNKINSLCHLTNKIMSKPKPSPPPSASPPPAKGAEDQMNGGEGNADAANEDVTMDSTNVNSDGSSSADLDSNNTQSNTA